MKKAFFAFLLILLFFIFPFQKSFADSNFSTAYNVEYDVNKDASTHVNLNAALTNLTDNFYASSYSVQVGFTDIRNLKASDADGNITPQVSKKPNGSVINLNFNSNVVGINKKLNFNISFDTSEVAQNFNNTWDINIPGISTENDFSSFNVTVNYPGFLGKPTFIKPELLNQSISSNGSQLFFTKNDLGNSGISIAFGSFQVYNLNLIYHLQNTNLFPISTEIALPPSTDYQDIAIENVKPKPVNVKMDKDGNWLAQYVLNSSQKLDIQVLGKAKVYLNPKQEVLDKSSLQDYLKSEQYWETTNPKIKNLSQSLKTPYAIYQYVVKTLSYDFSRVETNSPRLGAAEVLNNPSSAVCLEFTDLFIALARASGIPAREIDGYAYTTNTNERPLSSVKDILHAWPEYYDFDKKAWIMVDPTWGNTTGGVDYFNTLDFDHIAFVIKGENSNYPVPAGGYKVSVNQNTKDVNVVIGNNFDGESVATSENLVMSDSVIAGLPIKGVVKISNNGTLLAGKNEVDVSANFLNPKQQSVFINSIPPFGYILLPISFDKTPILTNKLDTIKIAFNNSTTYKNIKILPFFVSKMFILGGIIFVSICIIISLIALLYRSIFILRQRK